MVALLSAAMLGCTTTVRMIHCESWAYKGSSDDNPENNYMIGTTTELCGSKCGCKNDGSLVRCEVDWADYCFRKCTQLWEVECGKWVEAPVSVDFITREEKKENR
jgi:hypothetical protein